MGTSLIVVRTVLNTCVTNLLEFVRDFFDKLCFVYWFMYICNSCALYCLQMLSLASSPLCAYMAKELGVLHVP
jgi:hypothetical protein